MPSQTTSPLSMRLLAAADLTCFGFFADLLRDQLDVDALHRLREVVGILVSAVGHRTFTAASPLVTLTALLASIHTVISLRRLWQGGRRVVAVARRASMAFEAAGQMWLARKGCAKHDDCINMFCFFSSQFAYMLTPSFPIRRPCTSAAFTPLILERRV